MWANKCMSCRWRRPTINAECVARHNRHCRNRVLRSVMRWYAPSAEESADHAALSFDLTPDLCGRMRSQWSARAPKSRLSRSAARDRPCLCVATVNSVNLLWLNATLDMRCRGSRKTFARRLRIDCEFLGAHAVQPLQLSAMLANEHAMLNS